MEFLTVTSRSGENLIEFMNPPLGAYQLTRVIGRRDRFASDPEDFGQRPLFVVDVFRVQGHRSFGAPSFDIFNGLVYVGTENGEVFAIEAPY
jgi:hypothetical protein